MFTRTGVPLKWPVSVVYIAETYNLCYLTLSFLAPGPVRHLSFTEILDTSLKVSWAEPEDKNGIVTGNVLNLYRCS